MAVVARWTDYRGRVVELTDDRWAHILDGHADMADRLSDVGAAVSAPSVVNRDRQIGRVEHSYGSPVGRLRVVVVVIYRPSPDGWVGEVWTAHRTAREQKGEQLWP